MSFFKFVKYHGAGNDFVIIDNTHSDELILNTEQCKNICNRHFGVGADGVLFLTEENKNVCN